MARFGVQLASQHIMVDLDHEDVVSIREELLRTRFLIGTTADHEGEGALPIQVLIPAGSIRWITSGAQCGGSDFGPGRRHHS